MSDGGEVVGREDLSLNDREIDFDLVEPAGVDRCMNQLLAAIEDYLLKRNQNPKPYRWHAKRHEILAKLERARKAAAAVSN